MLFKSIKQFFAIFLVFFSWQCSAQFNQTVNLSELDGRDGFAIHGANEGDASGFPVSHAGDVNGDGIDDVIIGAGGTDLDNTSNSGSGYVIFGSDSGFPHPLNLAAIDGDNGFVINGETTDDYAGEVLNGMGDINNDGFDDVIVAVPDADSNGNSATGRVYVVYGSADGPVHPFSLAHIDGDNGFVINGVNESDYLASALSSAGDINGDAIDDFVLAASSAAPNGNDRAGVSYVIFGSNNGFTHPYSLSSLNGDNGFVINGVNENDRSGRSVSAAGDVNDDGFGDLIIGAPFTDLNGHADYGSSYVIFGSDSTFPSPLNLSTIDGDNGFIINGLAHGDRLGTSVSAAGDINDDGIDDVVIGAPWTKPDGATRTGSAYVVFGSDKEIPHPFDLSSIDGSNGVIIIGDSENDDFGESVSAAGDVNGDGINDVIIGAFRDFSGQAGSAYAILGRRGVFPTPLNMSTLESESGFEINGVAPYDYTGYSVSQAGDMNSDGFDDVIIGAFGASPNGVSDAGSSFVVFGREKPIFANGFE